MIHEKINLKNQFPKLGNDVFLTSYVHKNTDELDPARKRLTVLVCPGGAYRFTSSREAEPVAIALMAKGFNAFVLNYSTGEHVPYPTQLLEASAALVYIRQNSEKYNVKSDAVVVCGFSAGGHLACSLGALWNEAFIEKELGIAHGENRPDGMILGYPVITSGEFAHRGSFEHLLGQNPEKTLLEKLSLENSVGAHTPPTFLWHTYDDEGVLCENSLLLASALRKAGVPLEFHIYPSGVHGLSLATRETQFINNPAHINPHVESWFDLCVSWLRRYIDNEGA